MTTSEIFGDVIYSYTRADALEDGALVDVSETAKEAGFRYPVAVTRSVWDEIITPDPRAVGQDVNARLWDALYMLSRYIRVSSGQSVIMFSFVAIMKAAQRRNIILKSVCSPGDNGKPVITIMKPTED